MRNGAVGDDVRQMAAVLLRRVISNEFEEFYSKVCVDIVLHNLTPYFNVYSLRSFFYTMNYLLLFSYQLKIRRSSKMNCC